MAVETISFRFKSELVTGGAWSSWMHCSMKTFKQWLETAHKLNEHAPKAVRSAQGWNVINEINICVYRTDREYTWTPQTGWRDITAEMKALDVKQQIPTESNHAYLGDIDHTPTDDELFGIDDELETE